TPDGIDPRYTEWLWYYDADIIYSFVPLNDQAVAAIHEKYGPAHLHHHSPIGAGKVDDRYSRIELPIPGLRSLSIVPALLTRSWGIRGRMSDVRIIDKFWDQSQSPFIKENFGFLADGYQPLVVQNFPELFRTITLISEEALHTQYYAK